MDMRLFDRAQDAYNLAKKAPVQQKVMVFIIPSKVKAGAIKTELRFPYAGKIVGVYATCGKVGMSITEISLEKCSQADYDTAPVWQDVLSTNILLDANEKSTNTASTPLVIGDETVNPNDHFRVNVLQAGAGVEDITVEVVVQI